MLIVVKIVSSRSIVDYSTPSFYSSLYQSKNAKRVFNQFSIVQIASKSSFFKVIHLILLLRTNTNYSKFSLIIQFQAFIPLYIDQKSVFNQFSIVQLYVF